jgi:hypothetical protein
MDDTDGIFDSDSDTYEDADVKGEGMEELYEKCEIDTGKTHGAFDSDSDTEADK